MKKILFFTPHGGRTGSEMLIWNIFQHLDRSKFQVALYCDKVGSLKDELPADIAFHTSPFNTSGLSLFGKKLLTKFGYSVYEKHIIKIHEEFQPDYWYLNTNMSAHFIKIADKLGVKVISHISEMPYLLYESILAEDLTRMLKAQMVISVSEVGCEALRIMGANNVNLLHPSVDLSKIKPSPERMEKIKANLNIPEDAFVWAMSGSLIYRKGIDYIPKIIKLLKAQNRSCFFIWMGGGTEFAAEYFFRKELTYYGYDNIVLTGALSDDYYDYFALADAFLLPSHEETFGMVNVEAAYLGKPIITFNSGGVVDIMREGMGKVVNSWNVEDLVMAMTDLMDGKIPFSTEILKQRAEDFEAKTMYFKWQELIETLP
jgi:glycosyltransferase involved in cell wall biosynthesis